MLGLISVSSFNNTDLMDWYLEKKKATPYILNTITDQINLE